MKRFFTADPHFGASAKLIRGMLRRYPGTQTLFESTEAHDEHLIDSINLTVGEQDELFVLGDFAGKTPGKYRARIKCKHVYLVRGNHDPYEASKNVFGEVPFIKFTKLRAEGHHPMPVVLCHTPIAFWDGSHRGWAHLYGHTHGQREDTLDRAFGIDRRSMDVGVDHLYTMNGDYFPVPEDELFHMFINRGGHDPMTYYIEMQNFRDRRFGFDPIERPGDQR
jgi:calcineurin-like phosphoesterase family protein